MRRSWAVHTVRKTALLSSLHISSLVSEEKAKWEKKKEEAAEKGFARRDGTDDRLLMSQLFGAPERISGGVAVANLPPKERDRTDFDEYRLLTTDFTSLVTPHGAPSKSGLGAGFGVREDKRLGFLRPWKPLQPHTGSTAIVPKFDENGLPIDEALTPAQVIQKRKEYMKSFEGTIMSASEHFLLVDLDFQKDAVLFGNTREEFERNVTKLKNVIIAYNRWEKADNLYYYATVLLKLLTVWVLMECLQQFYELRLFSSHFDDFVEAIETEIATLDVKRKADFADAAEELSRHRPDFQPVLQAIARERDRLTDAGKLEAEDAGAAQQASSRVGGLADLAWEALRVNSGCTPTTAQRAATLSALDVKNPDASHPMDTTFEERHNKQRRKADELHEMRRLAALSGGSAPNGVWAHVRNRIGGIFHAPRRLRPEEVLQYSYAGSPTSISSMRALRRILLPRSEDVVQIVREQMIAYKAEKERHYAHAL
ncbi:hypothetical protein LSCM1_02831 [Leishmania martiniquensis]|uniref:Uncharacterized protein n=1 Tax=Leishmania martiniquensis TaxID=1580590 RepID=A0A836H382_9TRYP|nr:hypothetical protein LSCM1_02831 [Leishmania martiniquensis]